MSTCPYRFVQVDVFTDRVFGGNPLAVFLDARGLDDALMQQIAREMNLSETVFLFPPSRPDYAAALRIFTPAREVPFAGHPTIGTAWVLATHGLGTNSASRFRSRGEDRARPRRVGRQSGAARLHLDDPAGGDVRPPTR
jgi:trans-2,3-dihydro-3-hydroxyanthranilate isomerase